MYNVHILLCVNTVCTYITLCNSKRMFEFLNMIGNKNRKREIKERKKGKEKK